MNVSVRVPRIAAAGIGIVVESVSVKEGAAVESGDLLMELRIGSLHASLLSEASGLARDLRVAPGDALIPGRVILWIDCTNPQPLEPPLASLRVLPHSPMDAHEVRFQLPPELLPTRAPVVQSALVRAGDKINSNTVLLELLLPPVKFKWSGDIDGEVSEVLVKAGDFLSEGTPILRLTGGLPGSGIAMTDVSLPFGIPELTLAEFRTTAEALITPVEELGRLVASAGQVNSAELMRAEMKKLATCRFTVAVVGEFKRGKSTFLNALAGGEFLPNDVIPCTAFACRFQYSITPQLALVQLDGSETILPLQTIPEIVSELNRLTSDPQTSIREAIVRLPIELCRDGVDLIDTPGLNDSEAMNQVTLAVLPNVDAAVLLLIPESPFSDTERRFLEDHLLGNDIGRLLFVLSAKDRVPPSQLGRVAGYIQGQLHRVLAARGRGDLANRPLLCVSSREELRSIPDPASGFTELRQQLNHLIFRERGGVLMNQMLQRIRRVARDAKSAIQLRQMETATSEEGFQTSLRDMERHIALTRIHANNLRLRVVEAQTKAESVATRAAGNLHRALLGMSETLPALIAEDALKRGTDQIRLELGGLLQQNAGKRYQQALTSLLGDIDPIYGEIKRSVRAFVDQNAPLAIVPLATPTGKPEFSGGLGIRIDLSLGALSWLYFAESAQTILASKDLVSSIGTLALARLREHYGQEIDRQVRLTASEPLLRAQLTEFVRRPFHKLMHRLDREVKVRLDDSLGTLESLRKSVSQGAVKDETDWSGISQKVENTIAQCEALVSEKGIKRT